MAGRILPPRYRLAGGGKGAGGRVASFPTAPDPCLVVIRGLDPRIHQSSQKLFDKRWLAGSSPAMTPFVVRVAARRFSNQIAARGARRRPVLAERLDDVAADPPSVHLVGT